MVGYLGSESDAREKSLLTGKDHAIAGALSGAITRSFLQPLDVLKIRFQLQVEAVNHGTNSGKYQGNLQAARTILLEEGLAGLWRGHNPGQLLSVTYGVTQFWVFEWLTKQAVLDLGIARGPSSHFVCGAVSGVAATLVSFPFDVIRTRFVAQGNNKVYRSLLDGSKQLVRNEGWWALFRGLSPTLLQIAPHAGAQFAFFNLLSEFASSLELLKRNDGKLGFLGSLSAGSGAGILAKVVIYPFDVARKRLQFQGFQRARQGYGMNFVCTSIVDCFARTCRHEGLRGLFKGLSPSLFKAGSTTAVHFTSYNEICHILASFKETSNLQE